MNCFVQAFIGRRKVTSLFLNSSNILSGMALNIFTRLQKYFISNVTVLEKCQYFTPLYFALIKSLVFQDCLNS